MRRLWYLVITLISFLTIAHSSLLRRTITVLLSGLVSFNSLTSNGYIFNNGRVNATVPKNSTITDISTDINRNKDICIPFLGCKKTPLPGGVENVVSDAVKNKAYSSLRKMIGSEVPIAGTEHKLYKHIDSSPE